MTFNDVKAAAEWFTELIIARSGRALVDEVTVPEPCEPFDKLYFVRLVSWGYVLFNEAGSTIFRELARLMKSSNPEVARAYHDGKRDIEVLRTSHSHNLPDGNSSNEKTKRLAEAWLLNNGGRDNYPSHCVALLQILQMMIGSLQDTFVHLTEDNEMSPTGLDQLLLAVDRAWPPYLFDEIVREIAIEIGLPTLDAASFRKLHQDNWVKHASLFPERPDATSAMRRVIRADLSRIFGGLSPAFSSRFE